jgi:hypothetical protein
VPLPFYDVDGPATPLAPTNNKVGKVVATDGSEATAEAPVFLDGSGNFQSVSAATPLPVSATETSAPARNTYDDISALAVGATAVVLAYIAEPTFQFRGFLGDGEADGEWAVRFDGVVKYRRRTTIATPSAALLLPNPDLDANGALVEIVVTNRGIGPADYQATLLGLL